MISGLSCCVSEREIKSPSAGGIQSARHQYFNPRMNGVNQGQDILEDWCSDYDIVFP